MQVGSPKSIQFESDVLRDFSVQEASKHLEFLVGLGQRLAGTQEMAKAARYLRDVMTSYGLQSKLEEFQIYSSFPKYSEFKILSPDERVIESFPNLHCPSTLSEGIRGDLVYCGAGAEEDFVGKDVYGKIALVELSYSPGRPMKAKYADYYGAKALVVMNWGPRDRSVVGRGAIKWVWGNPTPESWGLMPRIPSINISRAAGEYLKELLIRSPVQVLLRLENTRQWVTAQQPVGELQGNIDSDMFVLVNGHLEAWGKAATCNSCGNTVMLELARVLSKHSRLLRRGVVFAFWDGHEIAEAAGSTWYVDNYWERLNQGCVAYLNVDSLGLKGASRLVTRAPPETWAFLRRVEEDMGVQAEKQLPVKTGDNSVLGIGIPYIGTMTTFTERELKGPLNAAEMGWWYHSDEDSLDKVDEALLMKNVELHARYVLRLCCSLVVPFEFVTVCDQIAKEIDEAENNWKAKVNLTSIRELNEQLRLLAAELADCSSKVTSLYESSSGEEKLRAERAAKVLNRCILKLSRILTPSFRAVATKYDQDPYGTTALEHALPRLHVPESQLSKLRTSDDMYKLNETKLIRERNLLSDALTDSKYVVEMTLDIVKSRYVTPSSRKV